MVADLVDEDVGYDGPQRVLAVAPIVEQRPAVEPDHIGQSAPSRRPRRDRRGPWPRKRPSRSNSLSAPISSSVSSSGKSTTWMTSPSHRRRNSRRQPREGRVGQRLDVRERRRAQPPEGPAAPVMAGPGWRARRPSTGRARGVEPVDQARGVRSRERRADLPGRLGKLGEHPAECFARDARQHRVLDGPGVDPPDRRRVKGALADQRARRRPPGGRWRRALVLEQDRAGLDEIAGVARLAGAEQRLAGAQALLDAGECDELHRLARHQAERTGSAPAARRRRRGSPGTPSAAAAATSL